MADATGPEWDLNNENALERAKASFEQNFEQVRHLSALMNRIPAFAVTLTAGFWYVAVVSDYGDTLTPMKEELARFALMLFAGVCDLWLVCIAVRIRDIMADYLNRVKRFEGDWWSEKPPSLFFFRDYAMISIYSVLILAGTAFSWVGAFLLFWPSRLSVWWGVGALIGVLVLSGLAAYLLPRWLTR